MTWTYTGDPENVTRDAVRLNYGDIVTTNQLLQDAEVDYAYAEEGSVLAAAARCCEILAAKFADLADNRKLGSLSITFSEKSQRFTQKAKDLRKRAMAYATPYAGGISDAKEEIFEDDSDLIQPVFERDMMKNE